uniref:WD repeat-containing protein 48 isoform X2 n=1 Tax=Rhizophora mucronata TaxID=61149 RepID=A0A2P2MJE6_RHIMU
MKLLPLRKIDYQLKKNHPFQRPSEDCVPQPAIYQLWNLLLQPIYCHHVMPTAEWDVPFCKAKESLLLPSLSSTTDSRNSLEH